MIELKFDKSKWITDSDGTWLMIRVNAPNKAKEFCEKMKEKPYVAKIKEFYENRSLDANAYMWVLCDKIAKKLETTKENIYIKTIQEVGVFYVALLPDKAVDDFIKNWNASQLGNIAHVVDGSRVEGGTRVRVYYGSSVYDRKEMSILINELVFEAKELGIETYTPEQLAALTERWGNEQKDKST